MPEWHACPVALKSYISTLTVTDSDCVLRRIEEDLAIADFASRSTFGYDIHNLVYAVVGHDQLDTQFGQQEDVVLAASIRLCVAFLATMAADFGHGHALDAQGGQRVLHRVNLVRPDNRFD